MSTESGPKTAREAEERSAADVATDVRETGSGADGDLGSAGAQLSTAPVEELGQVVPGSFGGVRRPGWRGALGWTLRECFGWVRWMWRQLTSMRIALILLFLLSMAAIPGSLVPQTNVDELKAQAWKDVHPNATPIYERLGLFHVYSSPWFSAIYILLFISLAGCILPRSWQFAVQLRSRPPAAPRNLTRLPAYATWRTGAGEDEVLDAAQRLMRGRRFRTHRVGGAVASEKGFLREAGNLMFHLALFGLLISFAVGSLWKGEGGKLIVEGGGFSNNLTQYDDFKPGTFYTADDLEPFGFSLDSFNATYARTGPQKGTPRTFRANIHYWTGADGKPVKSSIEVNQPLSIGGETVYLIGHGYAPVVTVKDARGVVVYQGPTPFLPSDGSLTSQGVVKVSDNYRNKAGAKDQVAFSGIFAPTMVIDDVQGPHSVFPALDRPALVLTAYHGDLGMDSGLPQNVYQLNDKKMTQFKAANGQPLRQVLAVGAVMSLPDGGSLTFDGVKTWASFQVSHQVGNGWALGSAVAAILGLAGSLFIQRRRVWIRATTGADGVTVVELAGLGRSESAKIADEIGDLAYKLLPDAPQLPDPSGPEHSGTTTDPSEDQLPDEGARA